MINRKTAKALGLTIPPSVLARRGAAAVRALAAGERRAAALR